MFQAKLTRAGYGPITTDIAEAGPFYYAEPYTSSTWRRTRTGTAASGGTGVSCPFGTGVAPA